MRKLFVLIIILCIPVCIAPVFAADNPAAGFFKFPKQVHYKLLKGSSVMGSCQMIYDEQGKIEKTSSIKLKDFQGFGITAKQWGIAYIFQNDASMYASFVMEEGKSRPFSEIRLKEGVGFDGKKGQVFVYKEYNNDKGNVQTELATQYPVIDIISAIYAVSRRVALGKHEEPQKFNFMLGKSTKIMTMVYIGEESVPHAEESKEVLVHVLAVTYNNMEVFRFKIYKDAQGYVYPASVVVAMDFTDPQNSFEMRVNRVIK